ncbi:MAG: MaoC family dehydratase [Candidatus Methylomirabilis sp.]
MMQITEARPNGAFGLKVKFEKMMAGVLDWQRESPDGMRRLIASLYGVELNGHGGGIRTPKHADLYVGKRFAETRTLTESGTLSFGFLSGDFNPLQFNEALAQRTRFKGRIVHGFHTASLFSGVLAELTPWCVYLRQEVEFTAPVRSGDQITAVGVIEEIDERGVVTVSLECKNQRDEMVVRGKAILKKLKEVYQEAAATQVAPQTA